MRATGFNHVSLVAHDLEREAPAYHHIGNDVDDYEEAYRRARELEILERETFFSDMYELPDGKLADDVEQTPEGPRSTLYLTRA